MRTLLALTFALVGCGGSIAPTPDAATTLPQDASASPDVPDAQPMDQSSPDGALEASACAYAAGCCSTPQEVRCFGGQLFACKPYDDAGGLGWLASDAGACDGGP